MCIRDRHLVGCCHPIKKTFSHTLAVRVYVTSVGCFIISLIHCQNAWGEGGHELAEGPLDALVHEQNVVGERLQIRLEKEGRLLLFQLHLRSEGIHYFLDQVDEKVFDLLAAAQALAEGDDVTADTLEKKNM